MKKSLLATALLLSTAVLGGSSASADGCDAQSVEETQAVSCKGQVKGSIGWRYDPSTRTFKLNTQLVDPKPAEFRVKFAANCEENTPQSGDQALCAAASDCQARTGPDGEPLTAVKVKVWRQQIATNGPWRLDGVACMYSSREVPLAEVQAAAHAEMERQVTRPKVNIQPPCGITLVNLRTIVNAPPQERIVLPINAPVPGSVTGDPGYTWDFGNGDHGTGSGRPYVAGFDPRDDHNGFYLGTTYNRPGPVTVTATLTWDVTFTLQGIAPIDLQPITFTDTAPLQVREAQAVLVAHDTTTEPAGRC